MWLGLQNRRIGVQNTLVVENMSIGVIGAQKRVVGGFCGAKQVCRGPKYAVGGRKHIVGGFCGAKQVCRSPKHAVGGGEHIFGVIAVGCGT